ncbi:MAG: D-2-hydroxyacid dehydrogenase [Chthoniobacterales bacterium]
MKKIVVLDGYTLSPGDNPWALVEALGELTVHERTAPEDVVERGRDAEILLTNKTPVSAEAIVGMKHLKFIGVLATGYNIIDTHAAKERGIVVSNVPEYGTESVAQFTFALLLELCHHVGAHHLTVQAGEWTQNPDFSYWKYPLREISGKTLGIVGYGRIGKRVAEIGRAFGMRVIINSRTQPANLPEGIEWKSLRVLFAESDFVSLHCPQTKENLGFINKPQLALMKPSAFLINVARGALVDEDDLANALNDGVIAGAALDVLSSEPPSADNPLLKAKNCIITPHIAWAPIEARQRIMHTTAENIAAFIAGKPVNVVNP